MRAVNLLPRDEAVARSRSSAGPVLLVVFLLALVAALVGGAFVLERGKVVDKRDELEALQAELRATPRPEREDPAAAALNKEKDERIKALSSALSGRIAFDRVLRQLALVLPQDVWLSTLRATAPNAEADEAASSAAPASTSPSAAPTGGSAPTPTSTPPAPSAGAPATSTFLITGYTYAQEGVARLLSRLAVVPALENVRLEQSSLDESRGRPIVEFSIAADIRAPGDAA